jgi:hypothetical protein
MTVLVTLALQSINSHSIRSFDLSLLLHTRQRTTKNQNQSRLDLRIQIIMFTLYQTLGALAAIAAAPLAQALPVTSYNRIGASSNGMYIRNLAIYEPMALGHLTLDMSIEFQVDTHDMVTTCKGHWDPNGPVPQEEYVRILSLPLLQIAFANYQRRFLARTAVSHGNSSRIPTTT